MFSYILQVSFSLVSPSSCKPLGDSHALSYSQGLVFSVWHDAEVCGEAKLGVMDEGVPKVLEKVCPVAWCERMLSVRPRHIGFSPSHITNFPESRRVELVRIWEQVSLGLQLDSVIY